MAGPEQDQDDLPDQLPAVVPPALPPAVHPGADLVAAFLAGRNARTWATYDACLKDFARFAGADSAAVAVDSLLLLSPGRANEVALSYRNHLTERGLAAATIAVRLSALRAVVKLGRRIGRVNWTLEVDSPRPQKYRDTRGPGLFGWRTLYRSARDKAPGSAQARRDLALLLLLRDGAFRRGEVLALDLADVELDGAEEGAGIWIVGKGHRDRTRETVNTRTAAALRAWIADRGDWPGPLFTRLDRAAKDATRLGGGYVTRLVAKLGIKAGLRRPLRPHGLRHEAITTALDRLNGDVRKVRAFSRHVKLETVLLYDDARRDEGGSVRRLLGEDGE